MDHNTLIALCYVTVPALFTLACVLYATFCQTEVTLMVDDAPAVVVTLSKAAQGVFSSLHAIESRKVRVALDSVSYWRRVAEMAITPDARYRAMAYVRVWQSEALDHATKRDIYCKRMG